MNFITSGKYTNDRARDNLIQDKNSIRNSIILPYYKGEAVQSMPKLTDNFSKVIFLLI